VTLAPAILALCLLVIVTVRERLGRRFELGLLKALGWTTGDLVSLQVLRAVSISGIAITGGMMVAYLLVFRYGKYWSNMLYPDWQSFPIQLSVHPLDLTLPLLEVTGLVILPFLVATIGAALHCATCDPSEMLERTNF
jgi:ABC-type lipoprotein release transport system permease subunit